MSRLISRGSHPTQRTAQPVGVIRTRGAARAARFRLLLCLGAVAAVLLVFLVIRTWQNWTASQAPAGPVQYVKAKARSAKR